jgi:hypothetical protein
MVQNSAREACIKDFPVFAEESDAVAKQESAIFKPKDFLNDETFQEGSFTHFDGSHPIGP